MSSSESTTTETAAPSPSPSAESAAPRLQKFYQDELHPRLLKKLNCKNAFAVPRIEKIVLNMGVGEAARDQRKINAALNDLTRIAGQRAVPTFARRSVAGFKLREGQKIGCKVTIRGVRAYEFIDRLVNVALPRVRDFRGLSPNSFDGRGNFAFGLREQIVFPEIDYDSIDDIRGLDVIICTSAKTDADARALLEGLNFPFRT
ncbi:MAG: 50S ribosomal protein L5 [Alphaproteobacteria bacterium]|nr:50S ribosomal protein L5 [Alphaproteobacteria bacterium]MDA7999693.1 50S ribosomal protein L5 [Alphaproteobacteria bacterium]MDA8003546.1 50S ribosomal protein L5 [Alphaproteobacteria bacterium]MDA8005087.1 50S ribosomal protein L5 [Alphaproteobacteria bacterium]MDA8012503.1 50S ribosomal protein L5 [Alphaproteobacteria bacterium]